MISYHPNSKYAGYKYSVRKNKNFFKELLTIFFLKTNSVARKDEAISTSKKVKKKNDYHYLQQKYFFFLLFIKTDRK
jgi:hypothetical protein